MDHGSGRACGRGWSVGRAAAVVGGSGECAVRGEGRGESGDSWLIEVVECGEEGGELSGGGLRNCSGGSSGSSKPGVEKVAVVGVGRMVVGWSSGSSSAVGEAVVA